MLALQLPLSPACKGQGPLKYVIQDLACEGLQAVSEANNRAACESWCCNSATCLSWVFSESPKPAGGCWAGPDTCRGPHNEQWSGSSKVLLWLLGDTDHHTKTDQCTICHALARVIWRYNKITEPDCRSACLHRCLISIPHLELIPHIVQVPVNAPAPAPTPPPFSAMLPRLAPRPTRVRGVPNPLLSLHGIWDFDPNPNPNPNPSQKLKPNVNADIASDLATDMEGTQWVPMLVPSEYTLQGFRIPQGEPVVYRRNFTLPGMQLAAGQRVRVKLRADGCYSSCQVTIDGAQVGSHLGGFTPFELDITDALNLTHGVSARPTDGVSARPTEHEVRIRLTGASIADTMASGSRYAAHDLGGITRKIYLMVQKSLTLT